MSSELITATVNPDKKPILTPRERRIKKIRETSSRAKDIAKDNIDLQPRLFMTALFALAITLVNTEVQNLRGDNSLSWSNIGGMVMIAVFMVFTVWLDNQDGIRRLDRGRKELINDIAALRELKAEELQNDAQARAVSILIDQLIGEADTVEEKIKVVAMVPRILSLLPVETVNKTIAQGFEGLTEAISIVMQDATGSVSKQIKEALQEMLPKIHLRDAKKQVNPEDLIPSSKDFPTADDVAEDELKPNLDSV